MAAIDRIEPEFPSDSSDIELLVQCTWANGDPVIGYYFAHWEKHVVFWYEQVDHNLVTKGERPPVSKPHLRMFQPSCFYQLLISRRTCRALAIWVSSLLVPINDCSILFGVSLHVEMFCAHRTLPLSMVKEVKDSYESGTIGKVRPNLFPQPALTPRLDVITSDQSMFSYDADTTNRIVRILERVPSM